MADGRSFDSPQGLAREALRHAQVGDLAAAEPLFARLTQLVPNEPSAWAGLGRCRLELGRPESALTALRRAAELAPGNSSAAVNLAGALARLSRHADSLAVLDEAAAMHPEDAAIAFNRARALQALGRRDEALIAYDAALGADPRLVPALSARASLRAEEGDLAGGLLDLDQILMQRPGDRRLRVRRAELALAGGDWLGGLGDREARLELPAGPEDWRAALPLWQGEDIAGLRLLLFAEARDEGAAIGETLQMLRFVPIVAGRCRAIDLEVPPTLLPWLQVHASLPTAVRLVARGTIAEGDLAIALGSLPLLCDADPGRLPPAPAIDALAPQAARRPLIVGIAPLASGPAALRQRRDIPIESLAALSGAGIRCVLLQPASTMPDWLQSAGLPSAPDVRRLADVLGTLDHLVAADSWIAHVAAARRLPLSILLDRNADWTWLADRNDTPWYPGVRLYRQTTAGDWRTPVSMLARDLVQIAAG